MLLRIFMMFALFLFLNETALNACDLDDSQTSAFQTQKKAILERMTQMLEASQNHKLDILEVGEDHIIQSHINGFQKVQISSPDETLEVSHLANVLFKEDSEPDTLSLGEGQSTATTYLQKEGTTVKRALKIYDASESEYLYELLSCLFVQNHLQGKLPGNIRFSNLEQACFWQTLEGTKKFVLVFEGARGEAITSIMEKTRDLNSLLPIAQGFAILHRQTQRATTTTTAATTTTTAATPDYKESNFEALTHVIDLFDKKMNQRFTIEAARPELSHPKSLIHRDAHIGNIIYDKEKKIITFIDYETAFESVFGGGDPIRDLGCFMISVWTKVLEGKTNLLAEHYGHLTQFRDDFLKEYLSIYSDFPRRDQLLNHLKLHMWGYAGYMSSKLTEGTIVHSFPTIKGLNDEVVKALLNRELDNDWKNSHGLKIISE